jgi:hypothetical protein
MQVTRGNSEQKEKNNNIVSSIAYTHIQTYIYVCMHIIDIIKKMAEKLSVRSEWVLLQKSNTLSSSPAY